MGRRVYLGRGLQRLLFGFVREIAGADVRRAERLLSDLEAAGALTVGSAGYRNLNVLKARETASLWLGAEELAQLRASLARVPRVLLPALRAWEAASVALPAEANGRREDWLNALEHDGLIGRTFAGWIVRPRGRLALWVEHKPDVAEPEVCVAAVSFLRLAVKRLRHRGSWHAAARLADSLLLHVPGLSPRFSGLALTAALGYAQAHDHVRAERFLEATEADPAPPLRAAWQTRMAALRAFIATEKGDLTRAGVFIDRAARVAPNPSEHLWAVLARAWADVRGTQTRGADRVLCRLARRLPPEQLGLRSVVLSWRASALFVLERFDESRQAYAEAASLARRSGWRDRVLATLHNEAMNDIEMGESERAATIIAGLLRHHETAGTHHALTIIWLSLGRLFMHLSGAPPAVWAARKTLELALLTEAWQLIPFAHGQLAFAARSAGRLEESLHHYTKWGELCARAGQSYAVGAAQFQMARLKHYGGDTAEALRLLDSAREVFRETGQVTRMADVHRQKAEFLLESERLDLAEEELEKAQILYQTQGWVREAAGVPLLRLELKIRRSPGAVRELDLDSIRTEKADAQQQASMAMALLAIGFALLDDRETSRHYARKTLAKLAIEKDLYYNRRVLELARTLRNESPAMSFLISYWQETLTIPV